LAGDHWAWLVIAASAYVLRRARARGDDVDVSLSLRPGERYLVSLSDPSGQRENVSAEAL
jgi:hypothetical protein